MEKYRKQIFKNKNGAAALFVVLIISVVVLLMAVGAARLGLGESELGYIEQKGGEALSVAEGCAEEAMRRLKLDSSYSGESLSLGNGSCIIAVTQSGSARTIDVTGTLGSYNKKIQIVLTLSGTSITITSWLELST